MLPEAVYNVSSELKFNYSRGIMCQVWEDFKLPSMSMDYNCTTRKLCQPHRNYLKFIVAPHQEHNTGLWKRNMAMKKAAFAVDIMKLE